MALRKRSPRLRSEAPGIGIDPGLKGAIAFRHGPDLLDVFPMPVRKVKKGKRLKTVIDDEKLISLFVALADFGTPPVALELVGGMVRLPGAQGSSLTPSSGFAFGEAFAAVRIAAKAAGFPVHLVAPLTWRHRYGLIGADVDGIRAAATSIFPAFAHKWAKGKGRADFAVAALLSEIASEKDRQNEKCNCRRIRTERRGKVHAGGSVAN